MLRRTMLPSPPPPIIACQTATASPVLLAFLAPSSSPLPLPRSIPAYREGICELPTSTITRHASPETWRKKGYCATPPSLLVRGCPPIPPSSLSFPFSSRASTDEAHPEEASDKVYYAPSVEIVEISSKCVLSNLRENVLPLMADLWRTLHS
jgi:hypothetical protein